MHRCWWQNLKLNKNKCQFRGTRILFFGEIISRDGVQLGPRRLYAQKEMLLGYAKLQSFLGIMNYLGKFSHTSSEVCELLKRLTSSKCEWTWNSTYQSLYKRAETSSLKRLLTMAFYNENEQLYLGRDTLCAGSRGKSSAQWQTACQFSKNKASN